MEAPRLPLQLTEQKKRRSARGQIRGSSIDVVVPAHWPKALQTEVAQKLYVQLAQTFRRDWDMVTHYNGPWLTLLDKASLETWVTELNRTTLQVDVKAIKIGSAKYSRLAQMNTRHHIMTVSQFCLDRVPESALRYLIVHELAHLIEANHSSRFWALVKTYVPDYQYLSRLIEAVHRIRLYEDSLDLPKTPITLNSPAPESRDRLDAFLAEPEPDETLPASFGQLRLF